MTKTIMRVVAVVALISIGAPPVAAQQPNQTAPISLTDTIPQTQLLAMVDQGARLFNGGTCIICHAVGGRGDGQRGPNLTDVEWLHSEGDFEGILETVRWGVKRAEMKAMAPRPFQMNPLGGMQIGFREAMALSVYVWSRTHDASSDYVDQLDNILALLDAGEGQRAADILRADARTRPDSLMLAENAVNSLGYEYLRRWESPEAAVALFLFNTEVHPESWNTWDSLGEGYAVLGESSKAIQSYEKALELNPQAPSAIQALEDLRSQ